MIKMNGATVKRFYADEAYWQVDVWVEDEEIEVNGSLVDEGSFNPEELDDGAIVKIKGGILFHPDHDHALNGTCYEKFVKKWVKQQSVSSVVIEIPHDKFDELAEAVKLIGGKIKK